MMSIGGREAPQQPPEDIQHFSVSPPGATFTVVKASEVFPKPTCIATEEGFEAPFLELPGEGVRHVGRTRDNGFIVISNYRLNVTPTNDSTIINVPLGLIEGAELRELFYVQVACKDGQCFRIAFDINSGAEEWYRRIWEAIALPNRIEDVFALAHFAWAKEKGFQEFDRALTVHVNDEGFSTEIGRLRFDMESTWRVTNWNKDHRFCSSYPEEILIPRSITDADLEKVSLFRSARRIPSIVWRHIGSGAVLARCSQPEVGWLGWRSNEDEKFVQAIAEACSVDVGTSSAESSVVDDMYSNGYANGEASIKDLSGEASRIGEVKKVLIIDARSYAAAVGNRARGGGVECQEYYPNAEIQFMNLANIHSIRKSFFQLRSLCSSSTDSSSWFHGLDATKWFSHISGLLKAAIRCVTALDREGRAVLVHCSDGWDRTPQITSLAELLLDPYYRTMDGFQVLVDREWLSYGHKMADRCGNAFATSDTNERSPIFLQWLDCVHQLLHQFPCHFEFNFTYLTKLAQHVYSNLFGNFLCNSSMERKQHHVCERTRSVWDFMRLHPAKFRNFLYNCNDDDSVLWPKSEIRDLLLWQDIYVSDFRCYQTSSDTQVTVCGNGTMGGDMKSGSASECDSWDNSREGSESEEVKTSEQEEKEAETIIGQMFDNIQVSQASKDNGVLHQSEMRSGNKKKIDTKEIQKKAEKSYLVTSNIESSTDTLIPEEERMRIPSKGKERFPTAASTSLKAIEQSYYPACSDSHFPEIPTGASVRAANSSLPPGKQLGIRKLIREPIDSDGLLYHDNKLQQRMVEILSKHQSDMQLLHRDLYFTRLALSRQKNIATAEGGHGNKEFLESLLIGNGLTDLEDSSGVQTGSTASEVSSWEAVDEREAKQTLWVPDHALAACMRCHTSFWFGRRKHHCRSCGGLFCGECSNRFVPLPTEHLYHPVRICDECFNQLEPSVKESYLDLSNKDPAFSTNVDYEPPVKQEEPNG